MQQLAHPPAPIQPSHRCGGPALPDLSLPPAFCALYALLHTGYHAFAALHVGPHTAQNLVADTFGHLATYWPTVVARPNPTAHAWQLLTARLAVLTGRPPCTAATALQNDSVMLHEVLHYPAATIAALTGQEAATVTALLAAADRQDKARR
ncbi:hypothetical protein AB0O62_25550 [Streptomyces sp. NPDC086779]|uniref:hypothetical protein n=1 Tax=Streptomyces sp. NPDC086779 TaxID=3156670 RepID=UPI00342B8459